MSKALEVSKFVAAYVKENGRGCPKGELQFVGKFHAKDIKHAVDCKLIEAGRGSEGGLFPYGQKPAAKERANNTLKGRAFDYLRKLADNDDALAAALVAEYDAECRKRSEAQNSD